jgi:uncharacterized protein
MEKENTFQPLIIFLVITFGLSISLSILVGLTGGTQSSLQNIGILAMFFPALAIIAVKFIFKTPISYSGWRNFPLKWLPIALFIFPIVIHLGCLTIVLFQNDFVIPWQPWLIPAHDGLFHSPAERNWGVLTKSGLIGHIFLNALVGIIVVSVLAFFEEIGWRAWMLPRLVNHFNFRTGVLISSIVWAIWHVPFVLGGIHHINNAPLIAVLILNPLGIVGAGIILGWLWIRTKSIWIVSLAHGSLNNWGQYAFKYMETSSSSKETILLLSALNLTLFIVGLIVLFRLERINEKGQ